MELISDPESKRYKAARKKARAIRGFYINLSLYCIVIPTLAAINLIYSPDYIWFVFSMAGWGIGLFFHWMEAYDRNPFYGRRWEESKIRALMQKTNELQNQTTMGNQDMNEQIRYERIKKRVRAVSGFYKHLTAYVLVNIFLIVLKYVRLETGETFWSFSTFSTAFFWGIGLAFHALGVFGNHVLFGKDWEERKIRALMDKEKGSRWT